MNPSTDLQTRIVDALKAPGALPWEVPIVAWSKKDTQSDMEARMAAQGGLCIIVPNPIPTHAMQGTGVLFFNGFEVRVQAIEIPNVNRDGGPDLYELMFAIATALHWQPKMAESPLAGILAHPLTIAERPVEVVEGVTDLPGLEHARQVIRGADVIFNAVLQWNAEE